MTHPPIVRASAVALTSLALLVAPPACVPADVAQPTQLSPLADGEEHVLPTESCGHYFIAETYINGQGPFRMVLDTGASVTAVTPKVASAANVGRHIREMSIGPVTFSGKMRRIVRDLDHISHALGAPIDGILGHQVFQKALLVYDYPKGEVRLREGRLTKDMSGVAPMAKGPRPFVGALVGDRKINVLLDTGLSGALFLNKFDSYAFQAAPETVGVQVRIDGPRYIRAGRLSDDVTFGGFVLDEPIIHNAAGDSLIGQAIFKHFVVTFDQQSGLVQFLLPDGTAQANPIPAPPLLGSGLALTAHEHHSNVVRILPDTAAEAAGFEVDDRIVAINGIPVPDTRCDARVTDRVAGATITYTVQRGNETIEIELNTAVLVD